MGFLLFLKDYLVWHYGRAVRDFLAVSRDLLWFVYHFFSLPVLARTLFAPFARIRTNGISITDIEGSLQNITLNLISRAVGFLLRAVVIALGVISEIILALLIAAAFICWFLLPLIILLIILFLLAFTAGIYT